MEDENKWKWEVERLKEDTANHGERLDSLEDFKTSTVEKLRTIFERIKDLESTNRWMSQSFFYLLGGGVVSAIGALIVWLIQK